MSRGDWSVDKCGVKMVDFGNKKNYTPLKFNMEPVNQPLEKEIPIANHHFEVPC